MRAKEIYITLEHKGKAISWKSPNLFSKLWWYCVMKIQPYLKHSYWDLLRQLQPLHEVADLKPYMRSFHCEKNSLFYHLPPHSYWRGLEFNFKFPTTCLPHLFTLSIISQHNSLHLFMVPYFESVRSNKLSYFIEELIYF